jgi:catechol 2,3-dioxygenase-like lactoylglutathione lyase family enzyme
MKLGKLDHVNIRTTQLTTMIDWYSNVLGMYNGDRPDFPIPGAWMYADGIVSVHLIGFEGPAAVGSEANLKLEHFAFAATGLAKFEASLQAMEEQYRRSEVPSINLVQFNIWDPDGNHIHIDFPADE